MITFKHRQVPKLFQLYNKMYQKIQTYHKLTGIFNEKNFRRNLQLVLVAKELRSLQCHKAIWSGSVGGLAGLDRMKTNLTACTNITGCGN